MTSPGDQSVDPGAVVRAALSVLGDAPRPVLLHAPDLGGNAGAYVQQCIDTAWVSSAGAFVERFERDLADYTGAARAVAVVNGTAALHIALMLAGVQPGDEVLTPSLTFIATANAITYCGATCHFIDVEEHTLGIDPSALGDYLQTIATTEAGQCVDKHTGRRIGAVVGMHTFGHPFDLDPILELCERYKLPLIEDAAESLGSFYKGKHTGTIGRVGVLSFNGNKTITTGGGGAIITHDAEFADTAKHLTTTAKVPHRWEFIHDRVGYNYRMPNINAALGCAQLERLDAMLAAKRRLTQRYLEAFADIQGAAVFTEPPFARSNYWLNVLLLDESAQDRRDAILGALADVEVQARPVWRPMHRLPMYEACPRAPLAVTESLARRVINLPSSAQLAADPDRP